jgi:hypothetical protein
MALPLGSADKPQRAASRRHEMRGEVGIAAHWAPGLGLGAALLAPAHNGSRLKFTAIVEFKVPLVGGKIESYIGGRVIENIPAPKASAGANGRREAVEIDMWGWSPGRGPWL